jgi:hypothetical protein
MLRQLLQVLLALALLTGTLEASAQSFVAKYGPTKTPHFAAVQEDLRRQRFLENVAAVLSSGIRLPRQLSFGTAECGSANAYYAPSRGDIVICLELVQYLSNGISRRFARTATPAEIAEMTNGALFFIVFHEIGHALIDVLQLPVLGKEEDAADQIGTFFVLSGQNSPQALAGALWFFEDRSVSYSREHFSGVHSLGPQRQSNLACWAYGSNPDRFAYLKSSPLLPASRVVSCRREFQRLDASVRNLIGTAVQLPAPR